MAEAGVRTANRTDTSLLAELQISWWRAAYATVLPASVLGVDPSVLALSWSERIDDGTVLVATEGDEAVGFAAVDPQVRPEGGATVGTIDVLGVLPRWSRRGHGGRLIGFAAGLLRDRGATSGTWWIPEDDSSVTEFLASIGWSPTGSRRVLDTGEGRMAEIRYRGSLDLVMI